MKIVVNKNNLQRALGFVDRVTARNAALPILSNILLKTENGRLKVLATNLEVGITSIIGAKIEKEGQIAVPGKILSDFVRSISEETISLVTEKNTLTVTGGRFTTSILCFDAAEYPIIPKVQETEPKTIDAQILRRMSASVLDSIAISDSRPELAGALLGFHTDATVLAATDVFRLAEFKTGPMSGKTNTVIVPRATIGELLRLLSDISGGLTVSMSDNQISFSHPDVELVSRLIDGRYPDYKKVIPDKFLSRVLVRKDDLENAIKAAALFSSSIADIKIEGSENSIRISAKNSGKGEANTEIEANIKGDPFEVSVNHHYFLDGLKIIPTDKVIMEFTGRGSPFVIRPNDDQKEVTYLVMPLRG